MYQLHIIRCGSGTIIASGLWWVNQHNAVTIATTGAAVYSTHCNYLRSCVLLTWQCHPVGLPVLRDQRNVGTRSRCDCWSDIWKSTSHSLLLWPFCTTTGLSTLIQQLGKRHRLAVQRWHRETSLKAYKSISPFVHPLICIRQLLARTRNCF